MESEREADPYGLAHVGSAWYVTAFCHLRRGARHFRLDRMEDLTLTDRTFTRPADVQMGLSKPPEARDVTVRVLFDAEVARWVRESPSFFTVTQEETPEGWLVALRVRQERDLLQWLLSWGRHARVLEPESLRRLIAEEAEALWQGYRDR